MSFAPSEKVNRLILSPRNQFSDSVVVNTYVPHHDKLLPLTHVEASNSLYIIWNRIWDTNSTEEI